MTARGWCGTTWELESWQDVEECTTDNKLKYLVYQLEESPTTGAIHVQWYAEFVSPVRRGHVQRILGGRPHCEPRRGSPHQARAYCTKQDTAASAPSEIGSLPAGPGERSDLKAVQEALDQGQTPAQVARSHFGVWAKYYRAIDRYHLEHQPPRQWPMDVRVYYGRPGSGKSRRAFAEAGGDCYPLGHSNGGAWFDGYAGQHTVVIDDFYGWLPWSFLLQLLDRYPLRVPTKGGHLPFISRVVILTSNSHPRDWYDSTKPHIEYAALERRITNIEEMN